MPSKVFISYRRDDSAHAAGRVHDRLEREFGTDLLFMDVDAIPLGRDFTKVLRDEVAKCDVLLALIGPNWLNVRDEEGNRRLDNPADFLRIEIGTALQRDIPVIPILLDGARIPKADQLPQDLKELSLRHGIDVRHASFHVDMDKLIRGLKDAGRASAQRDPALSVEPGSGQSFRDRRADGQPCPWCPEMVVVPAGTFTMGSAPEQEVFVNIAVPFAVGKFAVTFDQWDACVADGGCNGYRPNDEGWGRGNRPVINVSWDDAIAYAEWLSRKAGKTYRLLSEAQWEYVARAGTTTPYWWHPSMAPTQANFGEFSEKTVPVDTFKPNPWGLFNVHGNAWEWTADCWNDSNQGNPGNGSARTTGDCSLRVIRGIFWRAGTLARRSPSLGRSPTAWGTFVGLRVARTLNP
jgi:formylglycine-generating enzyme required for sulfatase activity